MQKFRGNPFQNCRNLGQTTNTLTQNIHLLCRKWGYERKVGVSNLNRKSNWKKNRGMNFIKKIQLNKNYKKKKKDILEYFCFLFVFFLFGGVKFTYLGGRSGGRKLTYRLKKIVLY